MVSKGSAAEARATAATFRKAGLGATVVLLSKVDAEVTQQASGDLASWASSSRTSSRPKSLETGALGAAEGAAALPVGGAPPPGEGGEEPPPLPRCVRWALAGACARSPARLHSLCPRTCAALGPQFALAAHRRPAPPLAASLAGVLAALAGSLAGGSLLGRWLTFGGLGSEGLEARAGRARRVATALIMAHFLAGGDTRTGPSKRPPTHAPSCAHEHIFRFSEPPPTHREH